MTCERSSLSKKDLNDFRFCQHEAKSARARSHRSRSRGPSCCSLVAFVCNADMLQLFKQQVAALGAKMATLELFRTCEDTFELIVRLKIQQ